MCIIVVKPEGSEISKSNLQNMWRNNPHGAGFMYAEGGRLIVKKGLMTFPMFFSAYQEIADKKAVVHFRWRTHGPTTKKLTHPFWVTQNIGMVHNGVIPGLKSPRRESDTSTYVRVLQERHKNPMLAIKNFRNRVKVLIEIGMSKLVFMDGAGKVQILNGQMGHVASDGCWYSNHSYTEPKEYIENFAMADYHPDNWTTSAEMIEF